MGRSRLISAVVNAASPDGSEVLVYSAIDTHWLIGALHGAQT